MARRAPDRAFARTTFEAADIAASDLVPLLSGADAVVHLAWLIQPGRSESTTHRVNVAGSERVFRAAVEAKVPALVYASSVGTYSPGPKDRLVDESWPTGGIRSSFYSRHKVAVERHLDRLEREHRELRVVRMRPGLIFKAQAATEIRRLFAGPFLPRAVLRPGLIPFVPDTPRLRFQAVHSLDVGDAYRRAVLSDARGAFNLAADPPIGPGELAQILRARRLKLPRQILRTAAAVTFTLRLQPSEPAGSTWRSRCRCSTPAGPVRNWDATPTHRHRRHSRVDRGDATRHRRSHAAAGRIDQRARPHPRASHRCRRTSVTERCPTRRLAGAES